MTESTTLGELIAAHGGLIQTGPFGSQLHQSDYSEDGIPVVMPKDIRGGRVDENGIARVPEIKARSLSRHYLKPGSIVFPRRGEISKCAYIDEGRAGFLCGTGCFKIEPPEEVLKPKFLYYYLGLRHVVEWLERNAVGTTMLNLNTKIIGGIRIPLIPMQTQETIVSILSAYDDLIENKRLDQVARDFVQHYSTAWETGKAMMVCIDKVTCVRMYDLIVKYWDERIAELEAEGDEGELSAVTGEQKELLKRQIDWMRETRVAVVVSEEQGEVDKFRKWDIDITPHRRLIKEGIDLPESMRSKPQFRNMQRMDLDEAFKEEEHPFRIAIVCAMWLTGFDVPCLSTLYLDKPLKAHTLMQAIARANRVHEGKNNGLIVDYCGILKHLRKALATFAGTEVGGQGGEIDPAKPEEELLADLAETIAFVRAFLDERSTSLDDVIRKTGFERNAAIVACKGAANRNDETRKRFEVMCREVFKKFKACINVRGINAHRADRDTINIVYKSLQQDREQADITDVIQQLHQVVDEAIETTADGVTDKHVPYDISKIDFDRLKREFEHSPGKNTTVQNLRHVVEQRLQRLLKQNPLRTNFQQHYEEIVTEYNREKDQVTIEQTFVALLKLVQELDEEDSRAVREGLDEESLAIFDLLKKQNISASEIKRIKAVAVGLLKKLKMKKLRVDHWRDKEATRDAVRATIRNFLWSDKTGLPVESYTEDDVSTITIEVFKHVYRAYPTVPSPCYAEAA